MKILERKFLAISFLGLLVCGTLSSGNVNAQVETAQSFTPVCQRSPYMKGLLQKWMAKSCSEITEESLVTYLSNAKNLTLYPIHNQGDLGSIPDELKSPLFKAGDFSGFSNLETLELVGGANSYYQPMTLTSGHLEHLTQLKKLVIRSGNIIKVDALAFSKLTRLTHLEFIFMPTQMDERAFVGLTNLETLDLSLVDHTYFQAGAFQGLKSVKSLRLRVIDVNSALFNGLENLKDLFLDFPTAYGYEKNGWLIPELGPGTFDKLKGLKSLGFREFPKKIQVGLLNEMTNLERITFYGGNLGNLEGPIFKGLSKLFKVRFESPDASSIAEDVFSIQNLIGSAIVDWSGQTSDSNSPGILASAEILKLSKQLLSERGSQKYCLKESNWPLEVIHGYGCLLEDKVQESQILNHP
jgi:hypothetical protein